MHWIKKNTHIKYLQSTYHDTPTLKKGLQSRRSCSIFKNVGLTILRYTNNNTSHNEPFVSLNHKFVYEIALNYIYFLTRICNSTFIALINI